MNVQFFPFLLISSLLESMTLNGNYWSRQVQSGERERVFEFDTNSISYTVQ